VEEEPVEEEPVEEEPVVVDPFDNIKAFANGETNIPLTISDYIELGVEGLAVRALDELNEVVASLTPEEVDTVSELQALVATLETSNPIPVISDETIDLYLTVINDARAVARTCGEEGFFPAASPLTWNDQLYSAAYEHSRDLAESNTFAHSGSATIYDWTGLDNAIIDPESGQIRGSFIDERVEAYGYSWQRLAENLTAGTIRDTPQEAIDSWIASDSHCASLMNDSLTQVGMALYIQEDSRFTHYWSQDFGTPRSF